MGGLELGSRESVANVGRGWYQSVGGHTSKQMIKSFILFADDNFLQHPLPISAKDMIMLHLNLSTAPDWLELGLGVEILVAPMTAALMMAARKEAQVQIGIPDGATVDGAHLDAILDTDAIALAIRSLPSPSAAPGRTRRARGRTPDQSGAHQSRTARNAGRGRWSPSQPR